MALWHIACYGYYKMLPSLAEIVFTCAHCEGPLIAWETDAGRGTDCPHCLKAITVPSMNAQVVDKETFSEPSGLRRILMEVRDQEWESMRRKLRVAKAQNVWLEEELRKLRDQTPSSAAAEAREAEITALRDEVEALRSQLVTLREEQAGTPPPLRARPSHSATRTLSEASTPRPCASLAVA